MGQPLDLLIEMRAGMRVGMRAEPPAAGPPAALIPPPGSLFCGQAGFTHPGIVLRQLYRQLFGGIVVAPVVKTRVLAFSTTISTTFGRDSCHNSCRGRRCSFARPTPRASDGFAPHRKTPPAVSRERRLQRYIWIRNGLAQTVSCRAA